MIVLYCFTKYWLLLHIALLHIVLSAGGRGTTLGTIIINDSYRKLMIFAETDYT